jgi:para-aminobenzoate synthetase/4-amino-4-deoxychorismate lyase
VGGYARAFAQVQEAIRAGDIYQANLTFQLAGSWAGDPLAIYAALRGDARGGHGAVLWDGSHWHLSVSPELFFEWRDDRVTVRPMKGTAPRGATAQEDEALKQALAANPKDRAENLMIVDLMRNDLSRVAVPGTVKVRDAFAVETYPTVHQMVTTVTAQVLPGTQVADVLRAIFPAARSPARPRSGRWNGSTWPNAMRAASIADRSAISTCPIRPPPAMAMRRGWKRGVQCGNPHRAPGARPSRRGRGRATMGVGSAVVADSAMLGEWRECVVKGNFLRLNAGNADLIETMAFDPAAGIVLLERHLERMKQSAQSLGFAFDRHAVRNAIHALCFDLDAPAKVRLVLARSGAHALEAAPMPAPIGGPMVCAVLPLPVSESDWRLRHKTSDRGFYEAGLRAAQRVGAQEALLRRDDGLLTEGCFTTLFVERDGVLVTPRAELGLLPGVLRSQLLEEGRAVEGDVRLDDLANGFFLGNAVRGLMPARLLGQG